MKLTGPACTETMSEAEKAGTRERAEDNAGGVRVELRVRPLEDISSSCLEVMEMYAQLECMSQK